MAKTTGGEKAKAAIKAIAARLSQPATLRVGFLEGAKYPDGTSVALVAATNEYGRMVKSKSGDYFQLPRPFFRNMIAEKKAGWPKAIADLLPANNYDAVAVLKLAGEGIKGQVQQSITNLTTPPLAPSTIAAKGFAKPLIHTGYMQSKVDYDVKTKPPGE